MPAPLIPPDASLGFVLEEITYTPAILAANPLTATIAVDFDPLALGWTTVNNQQIQLRVALVRASALIAAADNALDELVDAISLAILLEVNNNRNAPQYLLYFGEKNPNEHKKPVLRGQLGTMRKWIPSLLASASPGVKDLGVKLESAVAVADAAVKAQAQAEQKNRDFRTIGPRRGLIDDTNALRKSTYGELSEMPHTEPNKHLPATFAEGFFRHESKKAPARPPTASELAEQIEALEAQLVAMKAQLVTTTAEEEAAAKAKSDSDAHDAAVAEAEKVAEEAAAKVAALKATKKKKKK
jgi:hypothetical protein